MSREYCQDRFGYTRRRGDYLIGSSQVVNNLKQKPQNNSEPNQNREPMVLILPTSERQCRPLINLEPSLQRQAWKKAVELAGHRIPSGKVVSQAVSEFKNREPKTQYKIGQKIKIQSNHSLFGGSSGTIKQIPNHTEVIVKLDNGQTESISNKYIQLELDSSIQELPNPGIAYGAFWVGSFPPKSRLTKQELVWSTTSDCLRRHGKSLMNMQSMKEQLVWMGRSRDC